MKKINLAARTEKINSDKSKGWVSLMAQTLDESNLDELALIAGMLEKVGVTVAVTRKEQYDFLTLQVDKEAYAKAMTRQAGRKADFNAKYDKYGKCTVEELSMKLETMSKTKIAQELGCSRMTLYRIIKNIELRKPSKDTSIWHYTS